MYEPLSIITLRKQARWDAAVQPDTGRAGARRLGEGALLHRALLRVLIGGDIPREHVNDLAIKFFSHSLG
jgi:hypothetical protein